MKIVRQTESDLVVRDSSIWLGATLAAGALLPIYIAISTNDHRALYAAGALLAFAIPWVRRSTFTFDAATQTIRWERMRYLRTRSGTLPFSEVRAIETQTSSGPQSNVTTYRLGLVTSHGTVPLSDEYSSGENRCSSVRDAVEHILKLDRDTAIPPASGGLDISIRALLQQDRRIDAIQLLCNAEDLPLSAAAERIETIDASMKTAAR
jgi:hypothetical protein